MRAVCGGDKVEIRGFGSFQTRQRQSRTGRNPAKKIPFFKPGKALKAAVNAAEKPVGPKPVLADAPVNL